MSSRRSSAMDRWRDSARKMKNRVSPSRYARNGVVACTADETHVLHEEALHKRLQRIGRQTSHDARLVVWYRVRNRSPANASNSGVALRYVSVPSKSRWPR